MSHENLSGACLSCAALFNKYSGFYQPLRDWFMELQSKHPEAHISCAGRGEIEQMALYHRGATRAVYGQSAHNYNCALDLFRLEEGQYDLDLDWFNHVIAPALTANLDWYGAPYAPFKERPHVEISSWNEMAHAGILHKVE